MFSEPTLEDRLRSYLLRQSGYIFIVAGSVVSILIDMFENSQSPLFGHFRLETVTPFSYADSRGFILSRVSGRCNLSELQINYLIHLTRGYPYYLDVLVQIAMRHRSVTAIASAMSQPKENVNPYLRRLLEVGFLTRQNRRYLIFDPVFELWLKEVFPTEALADRLGLHEKYNLYRSQVETMVQTFKAEIGKGNEARVRELFATFDGNLTFKGLRLPKFSLVRSETVEDAEIDILATTDTGVWVGEVKDRNVTRADVRRFVSKVETVSDSFTTGVLICLLGIDSAAYAAAQTENIQILLRDDVNFLMENSGKFPILI